ncbi:peptide/nickel transport system permease protein [Haladaptatus litoreus]|uniref:Peptide/nickel transport system permease protein n=1 Tax=Haladaptatus litoreus TaxID=553468 RepID=A0A1N7EI29_9EURY|nr:ABC transporter permease [Haladaptatus litoreus]SIR87751.1 peptide/nickel transport system permease protein [Haladaptatus litoreus]
MNEETSRSTQKRIETKKGWRRFLQNLRRTAREQASVFVQSKMAVAGLIIITFYILVALAAPYIVPYAPYERIYAADGSWASLQPPTLANPLGTTEAAHDVLSQLLLGARIAMFVGLLGAFMVAVIGTTIGVIAGYYGGWVDEVVMRSVDILYGLPFIPFVIVLVTVLGASVWNIILGIALLYWLSTARVIRSEVLTVRERPYVEAARAAGASDFRIMTVHILPNVIPLSALYAAIAVGYSIVAQASIAFLGFGDPSVPSWGVMLQRAFVTQSFGTAWWWVIPPGLSITLVVTGAYLVGRGYEEVVNPQLQEQ